MINHPLQSEEWEYFRQKSGVKTVRVEGQLVTIHKIPHTPFNIGYVPKGPLPNGKFISELKRVGKRENCIFVQLEPDKIKSERVVIQSELKPAAHPLLTRYTFILDLTKSEDELLKNMHPKTRYNIRVAQKHRVEIVEDNSREAFEQYLKLMKETTSRQNFFAHSQKYHRLMWESLKGQIAHLFLAKYGGRKGKTLVAWIVFVYKDTLYYPYGASSNEHREAMASNLMMWEVIKWGKKIGLKKFDMWGALGPNPNEQDPWFGFHRFKQGYGPEHIEFIGSYDLVIKPFWYEVYKIADKIRWLLLRRFV